ncbi:MAG: NAD(P)/FAD-dependent oxidoreductase [Methanomicrobiales archaeon]|nr:NAD(P)/FAD-dependent oxidoreductase [Methanomicrobiales archaeon]
MAAHNLSPAASVDVLEKQPVLGGCLSSYHMDQYTIERYYHHCFPTDAALFSLLEKLGIRDRLEWRSGTTGYYVHGSLYPLTTPREILAYPHLSLLDKVRLAILTLGARKKDIQTLDSITAEDFVVNRYGRNLYESFFEPLLASKFGEMRSTVSAAWLVSRIAIRSHRGVSGEHLGYLKGGFEQLIGALEQSCTAAGCTIHRNEPLTELRKNGEKWVVNGRPYDRVLSTIPPSEVERISGLTMPSIPYQGAACMTLGLEREVTEGIYWVNMKDPAPYGAVVAHTSFVPRDRYGESIIYLGSYFSGKPSAHLEERMLNDFSRRFGAAEADIHWHRLAVDRFAGPIYVAGYQSLIPEYEKNGLYMAGMFSRPNYPERSMEGSIRAGTEAATLLKNGLGS